MNTIRYTVTHLVPFHLCYYNHLSSHSYFFYGKGDLHKKISHLPYLCKWSKWHVKKSSKWHIYWYLKFIYRCRCTRLNELNVLFGWTEIQPRLAGSGWMDGRQCGSVNAPRSAVKETERGHSHWLVTAPSARGPRLQVQPVYQPPQAKPSLPPGPPWAPHFS